MFGGIYMNSKNILVNIIRDNEAGVWVAQSDFFGAVESESFDLLIEKVHCVVEELSDENTKIQYHAEFYQPVLCHG